MEATRLPPNTHNVTNAGPELTQALLLSPTVGEAQLRTLYPVLASPFILATVNSDGRKRVRTLHEPVSSAVVHNHLVGVKLPNHQTLGVSPNHRDEVHGWRTHFIVLDLDDSDIEPLEALWRHLETSGVPAYVCRSTTGRGWHLVVYLADPVPSLVGVEAADLMVTAAHRLTPTSSARIDTFPTVVNEGRRVLLPYRGASVDGYGFNPLISIRDGEAVRLDQAHVVARAPMNDLMAVLRPLAPQAARNNPTIRSMRGSPAGTPSVETLDGDDPRIVRERERLAGFYLPGKRQDLAVGFAGFMALQNVRVADALRHVWLLSEQSGESAEETDQRLSAVRNTYLRRNRDRPVAYRRFYEQAGVKPPVSARRPPVAAIRSVLFRAIATPWRGNGGYTDLAVLIALAHEMHTFGREPKPLTGEVAVACRRLALATNTQAATVTNALRRLEKAGLVEIDRKVPSRRQAFTYRFHAPDGDDAPTPTQSYVPTISSIDPVGGLEDCADILGHAAFHQQALGPKAGYVAFLLRVFGPQSLGELKAHSGSDLAAKAALLVDAGIAWHEEGRFVLVPRWREACESMAEVTDTKRLKETKRQRIDLERKQFHSSGPPRIPMHA